ncbi:phage tail protein [Acinetobacter sp. YH12135]|uniref:phage tail protein n=1 Tax=Acinetobacter sp. YH12135 TaxID=2601119 RepID=UPI0015D1E373|nr:phage tail protein [Acinetobacter sp. YH12135]
MSYYTKITKAGLAAITAAMNNNSKVPITYMAFGDGNGYIPEPDENATSLVNEVYRVGVNKVEVHSKNPNWLVCEAIIPSAVGGFNIREVALYDSTGNTMLAIASYPPTYKPTVEEGAAKIQTIRIVIQVDNSGNFELIVDPDVVLATVDLVLSNQIITCESVEDLISKPIYKDGQRAYLKSYYDGKATGWGYLIHRNITTQPDYVYTFPCISGGIWERERKDKKHHFAVDAGVLTGNGIDNTVALQRLSAILVREDVIEFPAGVIETTDFKIPDALITVKGKGKTISTLKLTHKDSSIRIHEATQFKSIKVLGVGVYEHKYLLRDERPYNTSDVDVDLNDCYFGKSEYIVLALYTTKIDNSLK